MQKSIPPPPTLYIYIFIYFPGAAKDVRATITMVFQLCGHLLRAELGPQHAAWRWLLITTSLFHSPGEKVKRHQDLILRQAAILGPCAEC